MTGSRMADAQTFTRGVRKLVSRILHRAGYRLLPTSDEFDGLYTSHQARFLSNPRFEPAYRRGIQASANFDPRIRWKIHTGLWAASLASRRPGDFIECGVNAGFLSSAILTYLDWASLDKRLFLVDTFSGPVLSQLTAAELQSGQRSVLENAVDRGAYVTDVERIRRNFSEWLRVEIIQGAVPEILPAIDAPQIAFLHLDMNCAIPEAAALTHFWPRIVPGAVVLCDDYAYYRCEAQGRALDEAAAALGIEILALPTGQGLIVK